MTGVRAKPLRSDDVRAESRWSALGSRGDQPPRTTPGPRPPAGHAPPGLRPGPKPRLLDPRPEQPEPPLRMSGAASGPVRSEGPSRTSVRWTFGSAPTAGGPGEMTSIHIRRELAKGLNRTGRERRVRLTGPTQSRFAVWALWIMQWTSAKEANRAAPLTTAAGPSVAAAIATMIRAIASEGLARQAITRPIPTPTAICPATSTDALFPGTIVRNTAFTTQATTAPHRKSPRPPRGTIPLLLSRAVDLGDKGFHRLWITLMRRPITASAASAANPAWAAGAVRSDPTRASSSACSRSASPVPRVEVERFRLSYAAGMAADAAVRPAAVRPAVRRTLIAQARTALPRQALVRSPW
jgi:hypothetical protein